jgi:NAD(P)-dependent dehydrogenase (short-subunit alcohol dehydrogenase family)
MKESWYARERRRTMGALSGKRAVVTGGSRGFGRGIVEALAARGMRVLAVARDHGALTALQSQVDGDIEVLSADVRDSAAAVDIIQRERPQVLVLNAGSYVPIQETRFLTWEAFSVNWEVDIKGTFLWAREALLAPLEKGSTMIIISSRAAGNNFFTISGYIAAKTAQVTLAKCIAAESKSMGIRVHYLLPALTNETELGRRSVQIFARRAGVDEKVIMEQQGSTPPLTPSSLGEGVVRILTESALQEHEGFWVMGEGLEPIHEGETLLAG